MAAPVLSLRDIVVRYGEAVALDIAALDIDGGQVLAILGPNGSGKSTLLRVMGLLQRPATGTVLFCGENALGGDVLRLRRRIASVFQEPLLLNATLHDNAALGLRLRKLSGRDIERRLGPWLERLGIAHLAARSARTLSGGEAQRTSLARALTLDPEILLLDEPFAALDPASRETLLRDFQRILRESKITAVFVTHHREEAFGVADMVGVLHRGRLLQIGQREEVFYRPASEAVAEIVGIENRLPAVVEDSDGRLSTVRVYEKRFKVAGEFEPNARVVVCLRAQDISVCREDARVQDSNRVTGRITGLFAGVTDQRVTLDCEGMPLVALLGRNNCPDERLNENATVTAKFSSTAAHVIVKR